MDTLTTSRLSLPRVEVTRPDGQVAKRMAVMFNAGRLRLATRGEVIDVESSGWSRSGAAWVFETPEGQYVARKDCGCGGR